MFACPYGVRSYNTKENVVEKCTLCSHLTADGTGSPACVHNCCCGARFFGDLDDPTSDAAKAIAEAGETNVHYLDDPGSAKPTCAFILSPKTAEWKGLV
jgi:Fe-S-cluster-containing dehydrogenase component